MLGICTNLSSLSLNDLSGKQDAVAGIIPYSDSPNDVQCFIDDSNARRKGMKNFNGCEDAKHRWLSVEKAINSLGQISIAPLNCLYDKKNLTKIPHKMKQYLRRKCHAFDRIVQTQIQTSDHLQALLTSVRDKD